MHTIKTSQALKLDQAGNIHIHNHLNTTGVSTSSNFKTGSSNLHSTGLEITGINVLGADTPIGLGATIYNSGAAVFTGVVTATQFIGDGSNLTSLPSGLGTALSSTQSSPLNKIYYTNTVLPVESTVTVDTPASASAAYTQYTDISVGSGADLIISDGDDLIPDVLGLRPDGTFGGGSLGRMRVDRLVGKNANSAVNVEKGLIISGVTTISSLYLNGDLDVDGHLNADNVSISGVVTAAQFKGDGSQLSGLASREFYGFKTVNEDLILIHTNNGADNISKSDFESFEDSMTAPSGLSFTINSAGELEMTI